MNKANGPDIIDNGPDNISNSMFNDTAAVLAEAISSLQITKWIQIICPPNGKELM